MPKSGKFSFHTGWKCDFNMKTFGENHIQGFGSCSGVTFNDEGKGINLTQWRWKLLCNF